MKKISKTLVCLITMTLCFSCSSDDNSVGEEVDVSFKTAQQLKSEAGFHSESATGRCASLSSSNCAFICIVCGARHEAPVKGQALLYSIEGVCGVCGSPFPECAGSIHGPRP